MMIACYRLMAEEMERTQEMADWGEIGSGRW